MSGEDFRPWRDGGIIMGKTAGKGMKEDGMKGVTLEQSGKGGKLGPDL